MVKVTLITYDGLSPKSEEEYTYEDVETAICDWPWLESLHFRGVHLLMLFTDKQYLKAEVTKINKQNWRKIKCVNRMLVLLIMKLISLAYG